MLRVAGAMLREEANARSFVGIRASTVRSKCGTACLYA